MQRHVLATNESALGVINGKVAWTAPEGVPLRPELDPEFVAAVEREGLGELRVLVGQARRVGLARGQAAIGEVAVSELALGLIGRGGEPAAAATEETEPERRRASALSGQ